MRHNRARQRHFAPPKRQVTLATLMLLGLSLFAMGCPTTTPTEEPGPPDGGVVDQTQPLSECPQGASCLYLKEARARSCAIKLTRREDKGVIKVDFSEKLLGRQQLQGKILGLVFLWQKHEAIDAKQALVAITPGVAGGSWKLSEATCYDAKGQPLDKVTPELRGN